MVAFAEMAELDEGLEEVAMDDGYVEEGLEVVIPVEADVNVQAGEPSRFFLVFAVSHFSA